MVREDNNIIIQIRNVANLNSLDITLKCCHIKRKLAYVIFIISNEKILRKFEVDKKKYTTIFILEGAIN